MSNRLRRPCARGAPPGQVQLDDGLWCDGYFESYRRVEDVWPGFVRCSTEPGVNYLGWFEEPRIRGQ